MTNNFDEIINRENTDCLKYDARLQRFGKADVQPLWVADMDFRIPDFITAKFQQLIDHGIYGYHIKTDIYYNVIVEWFQKRHNYNTEARNIIFTPGVVPAISYIIKALTEKGDKIILQPPVYYPFFHVVRDSQREIAYNQLIENSGNYIIDFDDLEAKAKDAKMIVLCSPHNPAGRVWTKDELSKMADICLKNNVIIVSDEIHCDLVFPPDKHIPIGSLSKEIDDITITCHSASKTFNLAGLSTAYVFTNNQELKKVLKNYIGNLHVDSLNTFGLNALVSAFTEGEEWIGELLQYLWANYEFLENYISHHIPQIKIFKPEATYMAWLDFREFKLSDTDLKNLIIQKSGLGLNDGPTFGPGGSGFQRINFACPRQKLAEALDKLNRAINVIK